VPIFVDDTEAVNEKVNSFSAFISTKIIIDEKENKIFIKGINYDKFLIRIKDMYETKSVNKLFTKNYTPFTQKLWEKKKIPGYKRKVTNLEVDLFFASELYNILMQLSDYYNLRYYRRMAEYIKKNTYLDNLDKNLDVKVDINRLNSILNDAYKPKDFQEEFIKKYFEYKEIYDLDGYILSFDQGLGKTFTAACISELIHPDQTIIVCMNTLKENWANELRLYFKKYNDIERFKREVYVYGVSKPKEYSKDTRYIIVNNESINKIFPLVKNTNSTMIIVDESQNFRNLDSLQTKNMLKLKQITKSKDNLMMSGTPIKANPSEIVPAMMMIDRTFTLDLAKLYIKAFTSNTDTLSDVVQTRFNRTIYRKTKDQVLDLPSKTVTNFKLEYKDEDPYLMINVKKKVADRFQEILESYKDEVDSVKDEFRETTLKYSSQDRTTTLDYIKFVDKGQDYESVHDSLYDLYDGFIKNNVYPNIKDKDELKRYKYVVSVYVYITQKCFFLAMGEVLPKVKAKAFNELYDNNKDLIYKMINNNPKKTVIFSTIVEVVDHIYDDLNKNDIKAVKITGSVKNRMDIINQFREDDTVDVLVATSQTMGTGVTLVEANQMMVFCPPYRKADFDQACDRIYRIGQTHPVNIYNIIGSTSSKDITTRMTDILDWSDQMVSSVLDNIVNEEALIEKYKGEDTNMIVFEEAIYDSKHTEPVYIVLMHSGTILANTIKAVTKDEFSHSCISFTSKLDPMFSFGNKKTSYIAGQPGFVQQNTKDEFFKKKKSVYEIYVMFVSKSQKQKMIDRLKWFKEKDKYLGYDIIGLIKYKLGISSDDNLKKWFCSRFVAELLGQAEDLGRDASLFSPQDFKNDLNFISLVNKGDDLYNYDYKVTERNLKKIKGGDYSYNESNINMGIIEKALLEMDDTDDIKESTLLTETLEDFLNNGMTVSESLALNEATLSSKERKSLPDKTFGLPEKRKFPLNDYDHVILAIKFFNRCDKKDQEELAKNIIKAMKVYKVPTDKIGKNNKLRNYINGSLKEYAIREGIGDLFKYKTEYKEIPPKVQKKDAINKVYQIGDKLLNSEKYKSIKKYVKKVSTDKDQYAAFLKGENNYYPLYTYKVPDNAQGRRDMFGPKFNEKEDSDYDWVDDSLIYKFDDELIDQVKQMDDCYSISDADNEMYKGDFYLEYFKKTQKIKVNKKTGEVVKESVGVPVVGLTSKTPVIVDNMYNNAFTSLEMDEEIIRNCMMSSTKALLNKEDKFYVPYIPYIQESLNIDPNIGFYRDRNGIFVMNENTKLRSPSYNDVDDIDDRTILYITYGELNDSKLNDL
jgi:SNF2 family DNA or RNA helicase